MAVKQWRKRPAEGEQPELPAWVASLDSLTPGRGFVLGAALSGANPKNLALTAAAAAAIAQAGLDGTDTAIAIAVFVVLGSVTVAGAVLFYLVDAERAAAPLDSIRRFMAEHNTVIMMVILIVLGAKILGDGLGRL